MKTEGIRLQKYMSSCGLASRRKSEEIIAEGKVAVNGVIVTTPGSKVMPGDTVAVEGRIIKPNKEKIYLMLNKPAGFITTVTDDRNRKTVMDCIKGGGKGLYPVGRLDKDTEGLLLFTNDGDFHLHMTHPSREIEKEYIARINGKITEKTVRAFKEGFLMDGSVTAPGYITHLKRQGPDSHVRIVIREGRKRQVRRMLAECGFSTLHLKRVRMGDIRLGDLETGSWRYLTEEELESVGF